MTIGESCYALAGAPLFPVLNRAPGFKLNWDGCTQESRFLRPLLGLLQVRCWSVLA